MEAFICEGFGPLMLACVGSHFTPGALISSTSDVINKHESSDSFWCGSTFSIPT